MRSRNALALSVTKRRRKTGFLRRERRFDVVSYIELAPYFTVHPFSMVLKTQTVCTRWISCLNQIRGGCRSPDDDCRQQLPRSAADDAEPAETGMAI